MILADPRQLPAGRLMALDIGEVRIGVAVCDETGLLATPVMALRRHATRAEDFAALSQIAAQQRAAGILVGLPLDSRGEIGPQARRVRRYTGHLARAIDLPVAFWDESYSTHDAAEMLAAGGGRTPIDAAAAAVILGSFLDARRTRNPKGEEA